jgi:hypothetical protein
MSSKPVLEPGSVSFGGLAAPWERDQALPLLDRLHGRPAGFKPAGGYERGEITVGVWARLSGVGLDMKDYVLARHLSGVSFDGDGFTVRAGRLDDPYTGETVWFEQAKDRAGWVVEIDHVVSLYDAWLSGGHGWSPKGRNWKRFYNFAVGLVPTARQVNGAKGAKSAADWLPPNEDFWVRFVILQV